MITNFVRNKILLFYNNININRIWGKISNYSLIPLKKIIVRKKGARFLVIALESRKWINIAWKLEKIWSY